MHGRLVYVSSLKRTRDTAVEIFGNCRIREAQELNEVGMNSFMDINFRLPAFIWFALGRVQWFINHGRQPEKRAETDERTQKFLTKLEANNEDCTIVGHAFQFIYMLWAMRRRGWKVPAIKKLENLERLVVMGPVNQPKV